MSARRPAVAGSFYPADGAELRREVEGLLAAATPADAAAPKVLVVPHAGYIYSGAIAAHAYRLLRDSSRAPSRVVLLGPAHRVYLQGMAIPGVENFTTPLGEVALDQAGLALALDCPGVCISDQAHELEHSLEVQLPFLQCVLGSFSLVPIVVGDSPWQQVAAVVDTLWGGAETLVVVSTDLSHFESYAAANTHDAATCERVLRGDTSLHGTDACGAAPLNGLLGSVHGARLEPRLLARCTSGDTAGDKQRVVGYGAFALH